MITRVPPFQEISIWMELYWCRETKYRGDIWFCFHSLWMFMWFLPKDCMLWFMWFWDFPLSLQIALSKNGVCHYPNLCHVVRKESNGKSWSSGLRILRQPLMTSCWTVQMLLDKSGSSMSPHKHSNLSENLGFRKKNQKPVFRVCLPTFFSSFFKSPRVLRSSASPWPRSCWPCRHISRPVPVASGRKMACGDVLKGCLYRLLSEV